MTSMKDKRGKHLLIQRSGSDNIKKEGEQNEEMKTETNYFLQTNSTYKIKMTITGVAYLHTCWRKERSNR